MKFAVLTHWFIAQYIAIFILTKIPPPSLTERRFEGEGGEERSEGRSDWRGWRPSEQSGPCTLGPTATGLGR